VAVGDKPAHRIAIKQQLGGQVNVFCGDLSERYLLQSEHFYASWPPKESYLPTCTEPFP